MEASIREWSEAILRYNVAYRPMQVELRDYLWDELKGPETVEHFSRFRSSRFF
jgi:hypothetical protein